MKKITKKKTAKRISVDMIFDNPNTHTSQHAAHHKSQY